MSATKPGRELASPDSRRRPGGRRPTVAARPLFESTSPVGVRVAGGRDSPSPRPATSAHARTRTPPTTPETWWESFQRAERARAGRLRSLWQMTPAQRVAAMRRGDLTYEQLAAWSARHPEQVPTVHGEFEWIAAKLPEVCE